MIQMDDYIGTGMTESSGIFTFPSTGIYLLTFNIFKRYKCRLLSGG
jgi:hypothetical protein